jgi:integral membrane protein (TIGR01906 family)
MSGSMAADAGARTGAASWPRWAGAIVSVATAVVIIGAVVAALFNPVFVDAALREAGSARILGLSEAQTAAMSDKTLGEMAWGPATFAFPVEPGGPSFYDPSEAAHLRDARTVLYLFVGVVLLSAIAVAWALRRTREPGAWLAVARGARGLVVGLVVVGIFFTLAFDTAFELFHRVFFPEGNYNFDPRTQRMVQLYPTPFWELTATVLAVLGIALGLAVWFLARRQAARIEARRATPG